MRKGGTNCTQDGFFLTCQNYCAFKKQTQVRSWLLLTVLKEIQESKKVLPSSLGGTQRVLRAVKNAARHGVWNRVQLPVTALQGSCTPDLSWEVAWVEGEWCEWLYCSVKGSARVPQSSDIPEASGKHSWMVCMCATIAALPGQCVSPQL